MTQEDFRDSYTGRCKQFLAKSDARALSIVNTEDQESYDFFRNAKCLKGNIYADCCEYCAKELCLYYNPEVNLVPKGQSMMAFLTKEEAKKYLASKSENTTE